MGAYRAILTDAYVTDFRPQLGRITVPNQLYWSSFGAVKAEMANHILENTQDCESIFFEDCGHLIPWVQAQKFNAELVRFATRTIGSSHMNGENND